MKNRRQMKKFEKKTKIEKRRKNEKRKKSKKKKHENNEKKWDKEWSRKMMNNDEIKNFGFTRKILDEFQCLPLLL